MTVAELIAALQQLPQDAIVITPQPWAFDHELRDQAVEGVELDTAQLKEGRQVYFREAEGVPEVVVVRFT